jgi:Fe2+ or Zn2+ uptake regulation protein
MKLTIRARVLHLLLNAQEPFTATMLCELMSIGPSPVQLSSLSSVLKRMHDEGLLYRVNGWGPRGGYGYMLTMKGYDT